MVKKVNVEIEGSNELFGFYIDKYVKDALRERAYNQTVKTGIRVTIADLIRLAIDKLIAEESTNGK